MILPDFSSREPRGLYEPIAYALAAGGKRIRPRLAILAAQLFGAEEQTVLPAAQALEIFHNFTLLHDDVMDHAAVRRGRATVHVKWDENTAILSGDQMLIEAYKCLEQLPEEKLAKVLQLFSKMATEVCEGQQYDIDFEQREDVTIADYMLMIRLKTAVLLATALQIGAYVAGADDAQQQALYEYGIHLGLAFQIQDDLLDCFGDPKTFGKAIGGDIAENKKTFLWLTARDKVGESWSTQVRDMNEVLRDYERLGVREAAEQAIAVHTRLSLGCLSKLPNNEFSKQLEELANKLLSRTV